MKDSAALFPVLSTVNLKKASEADRRLPTWLSNPIQFPSVNLLEAGQDIDELADYIDDDLRTYLKKTMLIERLFPVQKCLLPSLTTQFQSRQYRRPNDICVSSPTGSGKTLAFAIPIVNHLKKKINRRLRALIVLPTRDLAIQVHKTFDQVCKPTALRCLLAVGDSLDSQKSIFRKLKKDDTDEHVMNYRSIFQNGYSKRERDEEYVSNIDILISTPGILVDLMHNQQGFSLGHLEILVIDEADKLMSSHKHDWLNSVEKAVFSSHPECHCDSSDSKPLKRARVCYNSITGCAIRYSHHSRPIHKLLFSATLSSDPQLLVKMNLFQPRLYLATKSTITGTKIRNSISSNQSTPCGSPVPFLKNPATVNTRNELLTSSAIPEQLEEKMFITEAKEKLFILWYLFRELGYKKVMCFTNQLQTSFRLCKFLNQIDKVRAVEFSSNLKGETRQKYLNEFREGRIEVIVCTDMMARGMDVEGVEYVISYDMPSSEVYYVHRCGRSARAGKPGTAITLVDTKQLVMFKKIVQHAHKKPHSMRLSDVVEEMKVPQNIKKNAEKYELYTKCLDDYEDQLAKKKKFMS